MQSIKIDNRHIGEGHPCYIIAEISANHNQSFEKAKRLVELAKESGADAVKLQTYTPDTMTIDCDNQYFKITQGPWKGQTLYELYKNAYTPWEWQPELKKIADKIGITLFSTPFDVTAVDFLEEMNVPAYKIASFELVDTPLIEYTASKGKPMIISTAMSTIDDISLAVNACHKANNNNIILLKCTSDYPAAPKDMNLSTIPEITKEFGVLSGLSDHSIHNEVAIAAVCLGASVIEKHFTENRADGGPDSHFSIEPNEFKKMVKSIRLVEDACGSPDFHPSPKESMNLVFRRSIFSCQDIISGTKISNDNVRSIRPGYGLPPYMMHTIIGKTSLKNIPFGTPIRIDLLSK